MARGPSYRVQFRRRREGKTDYKARRALIKSDLPRVITRGSLNHIDLQIVEATSTGDIVLSSANSQELKNYGWKTSCGNIPSAYLTGFLCGLRGASKNIKRAVSDIGLHQPTKGTRIFAALKGIIDAGIELPQDMDQLTDERRVKGESIAEYASKLASTDYEYYERQFSTYLKNKIQPEKIMEYFEITKKNISTKPLKLKQQQKRAPTTKRTRKKRKSKVTKKDSSIKSKVKKKKSTGKKESDMKVKKRKVTTKSDKKKIPTKRLKSKRKVKE